jgi:hypothetical protein
MSPSHAVCRATAAPGRGVSAASASEGEPDRARASAARPCAHVDRDTAEGRGRAGARLHQGEERDPLARVYGERQRNLVGRHFWARRYFVSTVGRDERVIRRTSRSRNRKTRAWPSSDTSLVALTLPKVVDAQEHFLGEAAVTSLPTRNLSVRRAGYSPPYIKAERQSRPRTARMGAPGTGCCC